MPRPAPTQFSGIFISYRRDDSAGHAGRLYDQLSAHFGEEQIFMDIDHIEPGEDFVQVIEDAVGSCEILLTVIGRRWLASAVGATRRLDNPSDFVRLEVAAALRRNVRVIPVLVGGASMPPVQELPTVLSHLSRRQAIELSDQRWKHDVSRLVTTLEKVLDERREARLGVGREGEEPERLAASEDGRGQQEEEQRGPEVAGSWQSPEEGERRRKLEEQEGRGRATVAEPTAPPATTSIGVTGRHLLPSAAIFVVVAFAAVVLAGVAVWWAATRGQQGAAKVENVQAPSNTSQTPGTRAGTAGTPAAPEGMVYVPGGEFTMGRDDGDAYERPAHSETVRPFFIDAHEATCSDYEKFVKETEHQPPSGWEGGACPPGAARKPVTGVTWGDAEDFCRACGKRLPGEAEWEFAARGTDGRLYPWGGDWRAGMANAAGAQKGLADVGTYDKSASPFGALDMVGNAWEWTTGDMTPYPGGKLPERPAAGTKVLRGGSYLSNKEQATATYRLGWRARGEASYAQAGFRCVKDAAAVAPQK
jgi:formylglycine-generating enzyme required for sulfatase activity